MKKNKETRIAIIGSAGVGKTTLLYELKKKMKLNVIEEQARIVCQKLGYKNIYEIKDPEYFRFLTLKSQIKTEEKCNNFISDRSTIDCWVHWVRWSWGKAKTFETERYFKLAYNQALKYSHIIYIPRLIKPKEDGFRWNNRDYQNQIDRLIKETLLGWQLMTRTYIIKEKNEKLRAKEVLDYFKN